MSTYRDDLDALRMRVASLTDERQAAVRELEALARERGQLAAELEALEARGPGWWASPRIDRVLETIVLVPLGGGICFALALLVALIAMALACRAIGWDPGPLLMRFSITIGAIGAFGGAVRMARTIWSPDRRRALGW